MESLALADTIRRTARVFQGGMQRRNLPHFEFAAELARQGKLGKLETVHAHPGGLGTSTSGWLPAQPEPPKDAGRLGHVPRHRGLAALSIRRCSAAEFEKGGGMVGGGCLEWGSHCIDLCQWANKADDTAPVEYFPVENGQASARYANGVKLVVRNDGWLPLGSCPVRYEGSTGWVETGDSGQARAQLAGTAGGQEGGRDRRLSRPRSTFAISSTA